MNQSALNSHTSLSSHGVQAMITCGILSHISNACILDKHDSTNSVNLLTVSGNLTTVFSHQMYRNYPTI